MKTLICGESPSRLTGDGAAPFSGRCGRRLATLLEMQTSELSRYFALANLFDVVTPRSEWDAAAARVSAERLLNHPRRSHVICCGRLVARAFYLRPDSPPCVWASLGGDQFAAYLPHPSGLSLWWNDERNRRRAAIFLRAAEAA